MVLRSYHTVGGEYLSMFLPLSLLLLARPREQVTNATSDICGVVGHTSGCASCTKPHVYPVIPPSSFATVRANGIAEQETARTDRSAHLRFIGANASNHSKTNYSKTVRLFSKVIRSTHFAACLGNSKGSLYRMERLFLASHREGT